LEYQVLAEALGAVDVDVFFQVTDNVLRNDRAEMLRLVEGLMKKGYDLREFLTGLSEHLRNLIVARTTGEAELIESDEATRQRYLETVDHFAEADLLRHLVVIAEAEEGLRFSSQPRLRVELALLKLASMERAADLSLLLQQLDTLPPSDGGRPSPSAGNREKSPRRERKQPSTTPSGSRAPETPSSTTKTAGAGASAHSGQAEPSSRQKAAQNMFGKPALSVTRPGARETPAEETSNDEDGPGIIDLALQSQVGTGSGAFRHLTIDALEAAWKPYIHRVMKERIHVGALLQHAHPTEVRAGVVEIGVPDAFHERLLGGEMEYLRSLLADVLEVQNLPTPRLLVVEELGSEGATAETTEISALDRMKKLQEENPVIRSLLDRFGGELIW
jgi:hypothetical protein